MKLLQSVLMILLFSGTGTAQVPIRDRHITRQQERMVYKQWDKSKFTPTKGFLGLNPLYWLTWGLHPDYPKTDLRPLSPKGPQTQRIALAAAMQSYSSQIKLHADTLSNSAISEAMNYSPLLSDADPLWLLYYRQEFAPLLSQDIAEELNDLPVMEKDYLVRNGMYNWYVEEFAILTERLHATRTTNLDRGSRLISYHRLLAEYKKLNAVWETKKANASRFLGLAGTTDKIRNKEGVSLTQDATLTDKQIADKILSASKL